MTNQVDKNSGIQKASQAELDIEAIEAIEGQQAISGWRYNELVAEALEKVDCQ